LPEDVVARLEGLGPALLGRQVLILPTQHRGGVTHYLSDDVEAVKIAKSVGLDAAYLVPAEERTYIEEFSAGWVLELGMAVLQTLTVDLATGMSKYLWERAKQVVALGLHPGPAEGVPMRLYVGRYERDAGGDVRFNNLVIEGPPESVSSAIKQLVATPIPTERTVLQIEDVNQAVEEAGE
jgi:hypothetical protein